MNTKYVLMFSSSQISIVNFQSSEHIIHLFLFYHSGYC